MFRTQHKPIFIASLFFVVASVCVNAEQSAPAAPSTVLATQGGVSLTFADMDVFAERIPAEKRAGFFNSPTRIDAVISNLLLQKQLAVEARKAGMDHDLQATAKTEPVTDEELSKKWLQRFRADVKIPDLTELAKEQYVAHKETYVSPGTLTVKDVLISTQSRSEAEAKAIADTVESEAKANPGQFDALVTKYSDDPDKAATHGLLEQAGEPGKYVAEFTKAAKALDKVGDVSPVVSTPGAFHVMKLIERMPSQQLGFDAVKTAIIERLSSELVGRQVQNHVDQLRNQPMNADQELIASLRTRYGTLPTIPGSENAPAAGK